MGFAVYHQSKNWTPADFDTGSDRIVASLANIPRQIFEGIQLKKENELKDRAMKDKEKQTQLEAERDTQNTERQKKSLELEEKGLGLREKGLMMGHEEFLMNQEGEAEMRRIQKERIGYENKKTEMETKALAFRMEQAKKEGNLEGLQVALATELKSKKEAIDNFVATNKIFNDPEAEKILRGMVARGADPVKIMEAIAQQKRGSLDLFDSKSLSILSPMIEGANTASKNLWKTKYQQDDPAPLPTFFETLIRTKAYDASVGDIDEKDPRVSATLQLLNATGTEDESKLKAAISDVIHNRPANTLVYGKTLHQKISNTLKGLMRNSEVEKRKKAKDSETYTQGLGYPFQ
jgi:hypothetical protein